MRHELRSQIPSILMIYVCLTCLIQFPNIKITGNANSNAPLLSLSNASFTNSPISSNIGTQDMQATKDGNVELTTDNGLSLTLTSYGNIQSVKVDDIELTSSSIPSFAVQEFPSGLQATMGGAVSILGDIVTQIGTILKFHNNLTYTVNGDYIQVDIKIDNNVPVPRGADFSFRLPITRNNAQWWNGADEKVNVVPGVDYQYAQNWLYNSEMNVGQRKMSLLPFSVICVGDKAVCMAVKLDHPAVFLMGYQSTRQQFYCNYSLGFSNSQIANPNHEEVSFLIYKVESRCGIRSAAQQYYSFFPDWFDSSRCKYGVEAIDGPNSIPEAGKLVYKHTQMNSLRYFGTGNLYGWWLPMEPFTNEAYEIGSLPYVCPTGFSLQCNETEFEQRNVTEVLMRYATSESEINRTAAVVLANTVCTNATGELSVLWTHPDENYYAEFRCNQFMLPSLEKDKNDSINDLLDYYMKWHVEPAYDDYTPYNAAPAGVFFDNVGGGWEDLNEKHLVYSQGSLSYLSSPSLLAPYQVVSLRFSEMASMLKTLRSLLLKRNSSSVIYGNLGCAWPAGMFHVMYIDGGLQEQALKNRAGNGWGFGADVFPNRDFGIISRLLMYQKPISGMDYSAENRSQTEISAQRYLLYGMYPMMTGNFSRDADIYEHYTPIVDKLNKAGWEPMTYASATVNNPTRVSIERFGHWYEGDMLFTVHNWNNISTHDAQVSIEADTLAINPNGLAIRELTNDIPIAYNYANNRITFSTDIDPFSTVVFRLSVLESTITSMDFDIPSPTMPTRIHLATFVRSNAEKSMQQPKLVFFDNNIELAVVDLRRINNSYLVGEFLGEVEAGHHQFTAELKWTEIEPWNDTNFGMLLTPPSVDVILPLNWPYVALLRVDAGTLPRTMTYARFPLNLTSLKNMYYLSFPVDPNSIRVTHLDGTPVLCQWLPDFNPENYRLSDSGILVFSVISNLGQPEGIRDFNMYFDTMDHSIKPAQMVIGDTFKKANQFGVQTLEGKMLLISPTGGNIYGVNIYPRTVSNGYELYSGIGAWGGGFDAQGNPKLERFDMTIIARGPLVTRILATHGGKTSYSSYYVINDVFENGAVEVYASMTYAIQKRDMLAVQWPLDPNDMTRNGFYMGPNNTIEVIPWPKNVEGITNFSEPWFGEIYKQGFTFITVLDPWPQIARIRTNYTSDEIDFDGHWFDINETAAYHFVFLNGQGSPEMAIAFARDWMKMNYSLEIIPSKLSQNLPQAASISARVETITTIHDEDEQSGKSLSKPISKYQVTMREACIVYSCGENREGYIKTWNEETRRSRIPRRSLPCCRPLLLQSSYSRYLKFVTSLSEASDGECTPLYCIACLETMLDDDARRAELARLKEFIDGVDALLA